MMIRIPIPEAPRAGLQNARSTTFARRNCAILVFAAAFAMGVVQAQQPASPRSTAKLTGLQGNVLVSQADGMAAAVEGQALPPGARVFTTAGAKVTITYERGCLVSLGENRRYTVREAAECVAAKAPPLGAAAPFAVLAGPQVVNSGGSLVRGDLGVSPGTAVVGFPGGKVEDGSIQASGEAPNLAQKDAAKAYAELASQQCNVRLGGQDLGGQTLTPGVYCFPGAGATLTGELVLDAQGDPGAVFIFQVGTTLTTAAGSSMRVANRGQDTESGSQTGTRRRDSLCNVYWQVGNSAAIGRDSTFIGTIIASDRINVATNAAIDGRALARTGNVTLDTDTIQIPQCFIPFAFLPANAVPAAVGIVGAAAVTYGIVRSNRQSKSPN